MMWKTIMKGRHSLIRSSSIDNDISDDDDVMDDENNDDEEKTLPRTLCGHLPNKAAVEVR